MKRGVEGDRWNRGTARDKEGIELVIDIVYVGYPAT